MIINYCKLKCILGIVVILLTGQVSAATLTFDGDQLSGITELNVLGTMWDVSFNVGSYDTVYGSSGFPFATSQEVEILNNVLRGVLRPIRPTPVGTLPSDVLGCTSETRCFIATPTAFKLFDNTLVEVLSLSIFKDNLGTVSINDRSVFFRDPRADDSIEVSYATWTLSAVPVPAAVWLFGSGLIALAGFAKRKV